LERSLSARDEHVNHCLAELESHMPVPVDPDFAKRLSSLESACVDTEAAFAKRLEAIKSNRVIISSDDCDARVTALETVAADVNAWRPKLEGRVDYLYLQVQKVSRIGDRGVFDTSSHQPGNPSSSTPAASDPSAGTAKTPNGQHVVQTTRGPEFGLFPPKAHGPA
jgi:hypothetical protein